MSYSPHLSDLEPIKIVTEIIGLWKSAVPH